MRLFFTSINLSSVRKFNLFPLLQKPANAGTAIIGVDREDKWIEVEIAIKEYDQIILDLNYCKRN